MENIAENLLITHALTPITLFINLFISYISPLISHILISILTICMSTIIPIIIAAHLNLREKNQYIKIFKKRCPCIENYSNALSIYKQLVFNSIMIFYIGITVAIGIVAGLLHGFQNLINNMEMSDNICILINKYTGISINNVEFGSIFTYINSGFGFLIVLFSFLVYYWIQVFKQKEPSYPLLMEKGLLKDPAKKIYVSYWLFGGLLSGMISLLYFMDYGLLHKYAPIDDNYLLNWASFTNIYANLKIIRAYLSSQISSTDYVILIITSLACIMTLILLALQIRSSSKKYSDKITNFYKHDFPYIVIKTESGEIKGQLIDIENKSLISLRENNILNIVQWKKIVLMVVSHINKNEPNILDDSSINDKRSPK